MVVDYLKAFTMVYLRVERLEEILRGINALPADLINCAVVSNDGFVIAGKMRNGINEEAVGAVSAGVLLMGKRVMDTLDMTEPTLVAMWGRKGIIMLSQLNENLT